MRLLLGAGSFVGGGGGGLGEEGMKEEEGLTASELPGFAAVAILETSSSVLGFMFVLSSSRFRLPDDGVVVDPLGCCPAVESLTGTFADPSAAGVIGSLSIWSAFRLFFGRFVSIYLKWSS